MPVRINPHRALRTPRSILNQSGPNPRVVDKEAWAKLLWSALNLQEEDLPKVRGQLIYPLEMVRAVAVVWCFAALRSDEIVRLRVGCIRWQYEDVMIPETGAVLPRDAICFLDIPINKTGTAYTKAVHTLVGKRINEWERVRPREQPRALDDKTSENVQFLFSYRGKRLSKGYFNAFLIPHLCRKAGIPEQDSRGAITSHRARATIASMLYNAKEPLDIFQLKEYLGHKQLSSTQSYVQVDPTRLAHQVAKAGYLEQNLATIEVLLDQEAVMNGAAARGECWKYYDLGHGFCTNPFWAQCKHRLACARCPYYRPKGTTTDQLVEGKANLVRMLEFVALTEDEKLLVTEGIELHQELIEKLADVPTPAGLTPRELEVSQQNDSSMIPLKSIAEKQEEAGSAVGEEPGAMPAGVAKAVPIVLPSADHEPCASFACQPSAAARDRVPSRCGLRPGRARHVKAAQEGPGEVGARSLGLDVPRYNWLPAPGGSVIYRVEGVDFGLYITQDVISRFQVGRVLDAGMLHPGTGYALWKRTINDRNIPYSQIREGSSIQMGTQASIQVLWPPKALHKGANEELDNALIVRLLAPHFSMLLLGSAALSKFALSGLLTTIDPGFLKANIVQVVGEVGKPFPVELAPILQLASPSTLLITPAALSSKLSKLATTSAILPSQLVVGSWQIIQTAQAGSTTINISASGWNVNTE